MPIGSKVIGLAVLIDFSKMGWAVFLGKGH